MSCIKGHSLQRIRGFIGSVNRSVAVRRLVTVIKELHRLIVTLLGRLLTLEA